MATTALSISPEHKHRQRGRPRMEGDMLTRRQAPILAAAGRLLATHPASEIRVEQLLQETHSSRPSFYRWFPQGMEQVFDLIMAKAHESLMQQIWSAVHRHQHGEARLRAGIRAYFEWGWEQGPVVAGIYQTRRKTSRL